MKASDFVDDIARSVGFLSRLPVPSRYFAGYDGSLSRAVSAFPLAGVLIALPPAAIFAVLLAFNADPLLAGLIALGGQAIVTGALHEDGLSDSADGIGGGRDRESALAIMKDSRIGSYGAVALILSFGIRASALASIASALSPSQAGLAMVGIAALTRAVMVWHWSQLPPARSGGVAASAGMPEQTAMFAAMASGAVICLVALGPGSGLADAIGVIIVTALVTWAATTYIRYKIGGHTGDTIGASQQLAEMAALSALAVLA